MRRVLSAGVLTAALVAFLIQALSMGLCLQDDAFISLRYARHFVEGLGLVYNPGEAVEGYTNFLWTALASLPFLTGWDPLLFMRLCGIAAGLAGLLATGALARSVSGQTPFAAVFAVALAASLPFFAAEAAMGLETTAFAALGAFAIAAYLAERANEARWPLSALLLAAAALTRPEGLLVALMVFASELLAGRWRKTRFWSRGLLFGIPVAAHLVFRIAFYGDIVPNTFHAKVGSGLDMLARGSHYTGEFLLAAAPLVLLALAGAAVLLRAVQQKRPAGWLLLIVVPLSYLAYVAYVGGDYKPTYRFFALPSLFLAALGGRALAWMAARQRMAASGALLVAAALLVWQGGPARTFAAWREEVLPVHTEAGQWLGTHLARGSWLATGNAGVIPYFSRLRTIDMYGLCDRYIAARALPLGAGLPGHEKGDGRYVLDKAPEVILFQFARFSEATMSVQEIGQLPMSLSEKEIWSDPRFHRDYRLVSVPLQASVFHFFQRRRDASGPRP